MKKLLAILPLLLSISLHAQRYVEKPDPRNANRKIVEMTPVVQRLNLSNAYRNILEEDKSTRQPITFKAFDLKNPRTGKALNPEAKMTLKLPDGSTRQTTVKEFFSQVNELEKKLNERGRTLRDANSLRDLKPAIRQPVGNIAPSPSKYMNYEVNKFKLNEKKENNGGNGTMFIPMTTTKPGFDAVTKFSTNWTAESFICEAYSDLGTPEFPANWVKMAISNQGRTKFPVTIAVPSFFTDQVKKIVWQISSIPFDNTLKSVSAPGLIKSIDHPTPTPGNAPRGWESMPEPIRKTISATRFYTTVIDFNGIIPYPAGEPEQYYIRAVMFNENNQAVRFVPYLSAIYGHSKKVTFIIPSNINNNTPGFSYAFPEDKSIPFGVYIKGSGLNSVKSTENGTKGGQPYFAKLGYKIQGNAALGIRYFNFNHIIDDAAPLSNNFDLISAHFTAVAGAVTIPNTNKFENNGVSITINALEGKVPELKYVFEEMIPGTSSISLNKSFTQSLDVDLLNTRFMIGPVPIKIYAALKGEAGIKLSGKVDIKNLDAEGEIKPYISTRFLASGGVDAVIAYATLNAEVNPLLSLDMPLRFSSTSDKPLSFNTNISGLKGRVYLKAGFYYPCPSLEKIVGWLSGDEDLPLCECAWEYNIFDFNGFEHAISY
ncbi:MAG: hypothetical protein NTW29_15865 [Bacteroidetes bacterium]|nr:hypothetical protein [Bacteroidota bacterium]